jgi:hypothetical protein
MTERPSIDRSRFPEFRRAPAREDAYMRRSRHALLAIDAMFVLVLAIAVAAICCAIRILT